MIVVLPCAFRAGAGAVVVLVRVSGMDQASCVAGAGSGIISIAWHGHCSKQAEHPVHFA
jgi:hypothetical protein